MRCRVRCAFVLAIGTLALSCSRPLPEEGTHPATVYAQQCGACHPAYAPSLLTAKMWEAMVARMEAEMRRRGRNLSEDDRREILSYLSRNAGGR